MVYVLHKHPEPWIYHDISHYIHGDISMKYCTLKLLAAVASSRNESTTEMARSKSCFCETMKNMGNNMGKMNHQKWRLYRLCNYMRWGKMNQTWRLYV